MIFWKMISFLFFLFFVMERHRFYGSFFVHISVTYTRKCAQLNNVLISCPCYQLLVVNLTELLTYLWSSDLASYTNISLAVLQHFRVPKGYVATLNWKTPV